MKKERKKEVREMASAIDDQKAPNATKFPFEKGMEGIERKKVDPSVKKADEIIATKKLEIPVCKTKPVNGRIYVISIAGEDMKTPGGLILPPTFQAKKNMDVEGIRRYFVVAWDVVEIPLSVQSYLSVGIEVVPFLPQDAEGFSLPRVIDWMGNNIFEVLHYTELAGISEVKPELVS
jgi:hypothetical protein